jgi:hypothetical protein
MSYADCFSWAIVFTIYKVIGIAEENVPLRLRLVSYCTLADYFGGLKERGGRRRIRHVRKVLTKDQMMFKRQLYGLVVCSCVQRESVVS